MALLNSCVGAALPPFSMPTIITRRYTVRRAINNAKVNQASQAIGIPITYCVTDVIEKTKMHQCEIYKISFDQGKGKRTAKADMILSLLLGVPLMTTTNIDIPLGGSPHDEH